MSHCVLCPAVKYDFHCHSVRDPWTNPEVSLDQIVPGKGVASMLGILDRMSTQLPGAQEHLISMAGLPDYHLWTHSLQRAPLGWWAHCVCLSLLDFPNLSLPVPPLMITLPVFVCRSQSNPLLSSVDKSLSQKEAGFGSATLTMLTFYIKRAQKCPEKLGDKWREG